MGLAMELRVPAAAVHFPEEDRRWLLERIDEILQSGRLTLGPLSPLTAKYQVSPIASGKLSDSFASMR